MGKDNKTLKTALIVLIMFLIILIGLIILAVLIPKISEENIFFQAKEKIPYENGTIELCFSRVENCSNLIVEKIMFGKKTIAALYDLDEKNIVAALKEKNADIVVDEDNYFGYGKKIISPGLMHDKFYVIYSEGTNYTITGSMNPTNNDVYKNANNIIVVNSEILRRNYEEEFYELKDDSPNKKTKITKLIFNNFLIENYFCPEDECESHVLEALKHANSSIYFMTFSFTSNPLGDYIISKKDSLDIKGAFDYSQVSSQKQYTEYYPMLEKNMLVKLYNGTGKLHHKVFIIDNSVVVTGSYNPSSAGTGKNDENILIIHNKEIAMRFVEEFNRIY